jgi:cation transporter-like permease
MLMIRTTSPQTLSNKLQVQSPQTCNKMMVRMRKTALSDIESSGGVSEVTELMNRNSELETLVGSLRQMLDTSRRREKKLIVALTANGGSVNLIDFDRDIDSSDDGPFPEQSFFQNMFDRGTWLIGLLIFQSCSSFILAYNEKMLQVHPTIIYFLTMLVGAGGNAGNQAAVRVIRELALGRLPNGAKLKFILKEVVMALTLSLVLGLFGFVRVWWTSSVTMPEAVTVTLALMLIVLISIVVGVLLPIFFDTIGLDPAHSSTSIQVIMDICGVLITCGVATLMLDQAWSEALLPPPPRHGIVPSQT